MRKVNLLKSLPETKRNIKKRSAGKSTEVINEARKFGYMYWDGPREYGYGGYKYDGRWRSVARDIIKHYSLKPGMKVLDIGCGKGFLVKDLIIECPGLDVFGIDISEYAIMNCEKEVIGRVSYGNAKSLLFPDSSFDCILSINAIHNLNKKEVEMALKEIVRVSKGMNFIQVDSYLNVQEKIKFEEWVLTAKYHDYPEKWIKLFEKCGYNGDYFWTIV